MSFVNVLFVILGVARACRSRGQALHPATFASAWSLGNELHV